MLTLYFASQIFTWPFYLGPHFKREKRPLLVKRLNPPTIPVSKRVIWIHTLSVGEVQAAIPLLKALRKNFSDHFLVFTVATSSGYQQALKRAQNLADLVWPGPIDLYPIVQKYLKKFHPDFFILVETDVWPGLLAQISKKNIPMALVNAALSEKSSRRLEKFSFLKKILFEPFSFIGAATKGDAERLKKLLPEKEIHFLGNLKYEVSPPPEEKISRLKNELGPFLKKPVIVCGSTHPGEEEILLEAFKAFGEGYLLLCPRHPSRAEEVLSLAENKGFRASLRSTPSPSEVIVVDTLGELASLYALGDIAFVGGSLVPVGGHNLFEPLVFGHPVCFGPYVESISDLAEHLIETGVGFKIDDPQNVAALWKKMLSEREKIKTKAFSLRKEFLGVSREYIFFLKSLVQAT
ncbi:3-deoxy-D-manno-octulosonic acid transferase [Thermodesulfatator autotrophicus]|uniref:3-deoxy-D-manno-octulosonic acid transferase n=1 Tax=Thermodesulfatator autotrophicus TaxID=1795632 RepID=A0A177E9U2_9BACT|nr:glycosyltransferase N-terminal domain-containing protein [Thermodesulfatator autotrophicus]OAG28568.1 hypothetical protein TH606_01015 [Thermodesulfatator autotrophicus]